MTSLTELSDAQLHRLLIKERIKAGILARLLPQQREMVMDKARFKACLCSRRAGKTVADAHYALLVLIDCGPKDYIILATDHHEKARRLFWPDIRAILEEFNIEALLGWKVSDGRGTITTPEGGELVCMGLNDMRKMSKPRGLRAKLFIIDEVQEFEVLLSELWKSVVSPLLSETQGTLLVSGTPGAVLAGSWFEISTGQLSPSAGDRPSEGNAFSRFSWTLHDNVYFAQLAGISADQEIEQQCSLRGVNIDDPSIQREYFGRWMTDGSSLVHPFAKVVPVPEGWDIGNVDWCRANLVCTLAIDPGWTDSTAVVVLATRRGETKRYVVHAFKKANLPIAEFITALREPALRWCPQAAVADHGEQRAIVEFNRLHAHEVGFHVTLADKLDKDQTIAEMNDSMQVDQLLFIEGFGDAVVAETLGWQWKDAFRKHTKGEDHLCDALRYAFRRHPTSIQSFVPAKSQSQLDQDKRNRAARRRSGGRSFDRW